MQSAGPSCLMVDTKALYDASQKEHVHNLDDRRTFADGLTKTSARQQLCDRMREGTFRLVFDE
eukprot:5608263-Prorocentrum_lima.AAC.1